MLYSAPEMVFSVMLFSVVLAAVGAAGAVVGIAFAIAAVVPDVTLPAQFAAVTVTVITAAMSASTSKYEAVVAPDIAEPSRFHWKDNAPNATLGVEDSEGAAKSVSPNTALPEIVTEPPKSALPVVIVALAGLLGDSLCVVVPLILA
jgi:hypothetical protein